MRPLDIGGVRVDPPLVLAPMAGLTTPPFRLLCRRAGAGLVCGQLISAHALAYGHPKTMRLLRTLPGEHPVCLQLFGRDPSLLRDGAAILAEAGADIVDLNVGCAVRKVLKAGAGAALLAEPTLLEDIVLALVKGSPVPVTVKMRAGLRKGDDFVSIARRVQDAGAAAVTLHARPATRRRGGALDWGAIRLLKETLHIPVIGNGGVRAPGDARRMFDETGCDAVMIGVGAMGRPWVFAQTAHELDGRRPPVNVTDRLRVACAIWHAQALAVADDERSAVRAMRTHAGHYVTGMPGASALRDRLCRINSLAQLRDLLCQHVSTSS
ncbi:MAG: tRNA dihydrouridine synthase [Armatimonadota bacterium]